MMRPLDYGRSFVIGTSGNEVRFWIESRTRIMDGLGGTEDYFYTASCIAENTFGREHLFQEDAHEGLRIFGPKSCIWYRLKSSVRANYRRLYRPEAAFGGQRYHNVEARSVEELTSNKAIFVATHEFWPIVAQTEIWNDETKLRAIVEYPVKTMNTITAENLQKMARTDRLSIAGERYIYQVDTGPVAYPDLSKRYNDHAKGISMAYVAFNVRNAADFVLNASTPVLSGDAQRSHTDHPYVPKGEEVCRVHHYSTRVRLPAVNRLYALKD